MWYQDFCCRFHWLLLYQCILQLPCHLVLLTTPKVYMYLYVIFTLPIVCIHDQIHFHAIKPGTSDVTRGFPYYFQRLLFRWCIYQVMYHMLLIVCLSTINWLLLCELALFWSTYTLVFRRMYTLLLGRTYNIQAVTGLWLLNTHILHPHVWEYQQACSLLQWCWHWFFDCL